MTRYPQFLGCSLFLLTGAILLVGCATTDGPGGFTYKDLPVSKGNAAAGEGSTVTFKGAPLRLEGSQIRVGDTLRNAKLSGADLKLISLAETKGKVRIISIVPSVDIVLSFLSQRDPRMRGSSRSRSASPNMLVA